MIPSEPPSLARQAYERGGGEGVALIPLVDLSEAQAAVFKHWHQQHTYKQNSVCACRARIGLIPSAYLMTVRACLRGDWSCCSNVFFIHVAFLSSCYDYHDNITASLKLACIARTARCFAPKANWGSARVHISSDIFKIG